MEVFVMIIYGDNGFYHNVVAFHLLSPLKKSKDYVYDIWVN